MGESDDTTAVDGVTGGGRGSGTAGEGTADGSDAGGGVGGVGGVDETTAGTLQSSSEIGAVNAFCAFSLSFAKTSQNALCVIKLSLLYIINKDISFTRKRD